MRGADVTQDSMFSYLTLEDYVPREHPVLRRAVTKSLLRPTLIVIPSPGFNFPLRVCHRDEPMRVQAFISEPSVE